MYDFHDDAGHHHGSQYKQITAYKRQAPSLAWALLLLLLSGADPGFDQGGAQIVTGLNC